MLAVEGFFYGIEQGDCEMILDYFIFKDYDWIMVIVMDDFVLVFWCDWVIVMKEGQIV